MQDIYFLTFYTEGPEIDGGYNLTQKSIEIKERLGPFFKDMFFFNKRTLKLLEGSENICNEYQEELSMNPNANKIGYFDFKPFIIKKILERIPDNSILIYHDGNFEKNPQYFETDWENISIIAKKLLGDNNSDLFVQIERDIISVKNHVKTYTIDKFFPNPEENVIIRNSRLLNAARLIMRNTDFTKNFINEYYLNCLDKNLLSPIPNPNPDSEFKWSCGDQDVLNCLIYRYILDGKLPVTFPIYSFLYRVIRFDNRPFHWPNQSWNPHPTGVSKLYNNELINYITKKNEENN